MGDLECWSAGGLAVQHSGAAFWNHARARHIVLKPQRRESRRAAEPQPNCAKRLECAAFPRFRQRRDAPHSKRSAQFGCGSAALCLLRFLPCGNFLAARVHVGLLRGRDAACRSSLRLSRLCGLSAARVLLAAWPRCEVSGLDLCMGAGPGELGTHLIRMSQPIA